MPVYVAKTHEGKVESVVLARSYELAQAYWQGRGICAHSVDTRVELDLKQHPTGVLPIVHTQEIDGYQIGRSRPEKKWLVILNE